MSLANDHDLTDDVGHSGTLALVSDQTPTSDDRAPARAELRELPALDIPAAPFAIGGIIIWAVLGLVLLALKDTLAAHGHTDWLWICLAGFLLGFVGWYVVARHDRHRRARRAKLR
jgi:hypothetical protein